MSAPAELIVEAEGWRAIADLETTCLRALHAAAAGLEGAREGEAVILLADDRLLQELNRRFRDKDAPTNVLAFPAPESEGYPGDVAIALETCLAEAEAKGVAPAAHAAHLSVHGYLHLHGYDHVEEEEAAAMEALETAILTGIGLHDPYAVPER